MSWRVGVDIGGTFTDVAMLDESSGELRIAKVSTTPRDFSQGVLTGLDSALTEAGIAHEAVTLVAHATTVVTNALLEHKGAKTALVCTRGFRDVLELRRSARSDLYDLYQDPPAVLVPRHRRLEIAERIDAQGEVVEKMSDTDVDELVGQLRELEPEAIAISLLFSFLNDSHEARLAARLRSEFPSTPIFVSSEVLPEIREFERTSTTAVCAYVGPILESYLRRLDGAVREQGLPGIYVMGSSGGIFDVDAGLKMPAMAVESGPAAGVIAAQRIGQQLGRPNVLSFDMGGTTAKASLIEDGKLVTTSEYEVGGDGNVNRWLHGTGHPIRVPVIDLAEVSAGGGSIAWIDPGGALRVGPQSAGAEPGPVCYGAGGEQPTVTDANLILGYLDPDSPLAGGLSLDRDRAAQAIERQLAKPLGLEVVEAAASVVRIVNASMAEALRIVSVERGHDPRSFALVAFGGAGPMHAAALAQELEVPEIIIPPIPGGFSALGLVATDLKREFAKTHYVRLDQVDLTKLDDTFAQLEHAANEMLAQGSFVAERWQLERSADVRYVRQAYELNVPVPSGEMSTDKIAKIAAAFHQLHRATYGHDNPSEAVQLVNARLVARGELPTARLRQSADFRAGEELERRSRQVWFPQVGYVDVPVRLRRTLQPDDSLVGPAMIESLDSTIVIPPGWRADVDGDGCLHMRAENND
ncbi:MAG: hydantoinase/oxoprolinase family protein [Gammaproteobacteria bacterium]|nr:hydantoinase/oxoprolinase family protein [Gammaproteobacteria bacterium]